MQVATGQSVATATTDITADNTAANNPAPSLPEPYGDKVKEMTKEDLVAVMKEFLEKNMKTTNDRVDAPQKKAGEQEERGEGRGRHLDGGCGRT